MTLDFSVVMAIATAMLGGVVWLITLGIRIGGLNQKLTEKATKVDIAKIETRIALMDQAATFAAKIAEKTEKDLTEWMRKLEFDVKEWMEEIRAEVRAVMKDLHRGE